MQPVFFMVDRKFLQTKTFSQKVFFMFCLEYFSLKCIIKNFELKVNDPLKTQSFIAVLLKLFDVEGWQCFFQCARNRQVKQAGPLLLFLSFLENLHVPADNGTHTITGTGTTL